MTVSRSFKQSADILLSIRDLSLEARNEEGDVIPILKNINLTLHSGEVLGLVGESGAGKSMLGLAAMGYVRDGCRMTSGSILFRNVDLATVPDPIRRKIRGESIAYVAQSAAASFNPAHRIIDQSAETAIQHGLKTRSEAFSDAIALYRQMRLPDPDRVGLRYPHQLSGGQLQRAMTAMAMACRPDLIIFDEPTTALDVTTQVGVLSAIKSVVRQFSTAAIFISHDLAVVAQMADRIVVMRHGAIVENDETDRILSDPKDPYTKSLWAVRHLSKDAPTREAAPLLKISNVSAGYRNAPVLNDISMELGRGRTMAVIGESGSGKSTLARVITGLLPQSAGKIVFGGLPLSPDLPERSRDQRRRIQLVSQMADTAMNPKHRIGDLLGRPRRFFFRESGEILKTKVLELLDMVGLPADVIRRFPAELSGGQRQRVGIARALAAEPDLIICDEITSGLDQLVAQNILKLLMAGQQERNIAYILITHDFAVVNAIADDVTVMLQGRVVDQGSKAQVMSPPHHPYTGALLSSVPEMDRTWLDRRLAEDIGTVSA